MKKTIYLISLVAILWTSNLIAQKKQSALEDRFNKGSNGFFMYMFQNAIYPFNSKENNTIGLSVSKITITPQGKIKDIMIINSIDDDIDKMVLGLLKKSSTEWIKCDTLKANQTFYVQIAFNLIGTKLDFFDKSVLPTNKMFCDPVIISVPPGNTNPKYLPKDKEFLANQCTDFIKSGEYQNALLQVNELIKRYPYSKELYQLRMLIGRKLNDHRLVDQDLKKISNFDGSLSLDQLFDSN